MPCPNAGSPCYCTGACRQPCDHVFIWQGLVPPKFCPKCGSAIAAPSYPPIRPWDGTYRGLPPTKITYGTGTTSGGRSDLIAYNGVSGVC